MKSDRNLIADYLKGDEEAFRVFYERYRRPLYVYLLTVVKFRENAEELLQETFFSFLRHLEDLDHRSDYRPYLFRTARNRAIDWLRKEERSLRALEKRRYDPLFKQTMDTDVSSRSPIASGAISTEELEELLHRLPAEQRETVVLKTLGGLTFAEVGRLMGVRENTAVSRYRYGTKKLRAALEAGGCGERIR